ncbi:copper chaperone PCu(A)C [Nitrogeniibacter mangrovi]|uniref:Copper chaperone PCu(A)C n=2 Tax=Nitrogeniibacter mangrovi TaxID=2016596 RepID=A0A6C1B878_9RHOO|nr:copper chaperone PCu(A)C [Nitrogeniibacter mangrovi]
MFSSLSVWAGEVKVENAWVRGTVAAQKASGAFMRLTAPEDMRLLGASTSVAKVTEVHEMTMDKDIMKMHPIDGLDLPAGKPVALTPGGYHIMLMGLKAPLAEGQTVEIVLRLRDAHGQVSEQRVEAPVRPLGAAGMMHHN